MGRKRKEDLLAVEAIPIAVEIHRRMTERDLTCMKLSLQAGLNKSYVAGLLSGRARNPRTNQLTKVAAALDCKVVDLLAPNQKPQPQEDNEVEPYPLSESERNLLHFWRRLSPEQQQHMLLQMVNEQLRPE